MENINSVNNSDVASLQSLGKGMEHLNANNIATTTKHLLLYSIELFQRNVETFPMRFLISFMLSPRENITLLITYLSFSKTALVYKLVREYNYIPSRIIRVFHKNYFLAALLQYMKKKIKPKLFAYDFLMFNPVT